MFADREASRQEGEPITLYLFVYGETDDAYFAYTDAEEPVTYGTDAAGQPITYQPVAIDRGDIESAGGMDVPALEVRIENDLAMVSRFEQSPPMRRVALKIREGHAGDSEFLVSWTGYVLGGGRQGNEAVYTCESVLAALRRNGLRRTYSLGCNLLLYKTGPNQCNADEEAATSVREVISVSGAFVTMAAGWAGAHDPQKYLNGTIKWANAEDGRQEIRNIHRITGDTLLLSSRVVGLPANTDVQIALGCRHDLTDCEFLHNNIQNYGGQAWIPLKVPTGLTNNYY